MTKDVLLSFLAVFSLASSTIAQAEGRFPSSVDSLDQARRIVSTNPTKHVLVFYTNYRR
jgi:hypothetical protein